MHPVTHLLTGWALANAWPEANPLSRRDRALITWAGVVPDLDGLGVVGDLLTQNRPNPLTWYDDYHHILAHNLAFGLALTVMAWAAATRRWATAFGVLVAFHLHLLGDLVGSKGPDGDHWPMPYLYPFSDRGLWIWQGQWGYKAWPNTAISLALIALTLYWAWRRGRSPVELFSPRGDAALTRTLRARFGEPEQAR